MIATMVIAACAGEGDGTADGTTTVPAMAPIDDGTWFAFVTVGEDESGAMTLGVDLAEMLTGEQARAEAVADGVIGEGEDLPNDFYIDNDEQVLELVQVAEDARFTLISGNDTSESVVVDGPVLAEIYAGTHTGEPVYGIVPGMPIPMDVIIVDGLVSGATAVYLP